MKPRSDTTGLSMFYCENRKYVYGVDIMYVFHWFHGLIEYFLVFYTCRLSNGNSNLFHFACTPSLSITTVPWLFGILNQSLYSKLIVSKMDINLFSSMPQMCIALFTSHDTFSVMANRKIPVISTVNPNDSSQYSNGAFSGSSTPTTPKITQ